MRNYNSINAYSVFKDFYNQYGCNLDDVYLKLANPALLKK